MTSHAYAAAAVHVPAAPERVFALVTDWARHGEWMFMTSARETGPGRVEAYTGVWPFGFLDTMTIRRWEPPTLVLMEHTGRLVRGLGAVRVVPVSGGSRVIWAERLELPYGVVGRALWPLAHPVAVLLARYSLRRLAALLA
jgi:uncharacterized protein YndB with AHSA1/START domain